MNKKKLILPILLALFLFVSIGASAAATNTFNTTEITKSAGNLKLFVDSNHRAPNTVSVYNTGNVKQTVNTQQFLYLATKATTNINKNITTPITIKTTAKPTGPSESLTGSSLTKAQYLTVANNVATFISKNGKAPNFATTPIGKIRYDNLVYTYSKILNYYGVNKRLPNTVSVQKWSTTTYTGIPKPVTVTDTSKAKIKWTKSDSTGYVELIGPYGNANSKNKVAVIVGVHPLEGNAHLAMTNALKSSSSSLKNVQIWVFSVNVKVKYWTNYETSRTLGQNLAKKFVVPYIDSSYKLVVDTHGNRGNYKYNDNQLMADFIFAPNKDTKSVSYANKIKSKTNFLNYYYVPGTSPKDVTIPIAQKGIPAVVYELYTNIYNYPTALYNKCLQVVKALNTIVYV